MKENIMFILFISAIAFTFATLVSAVAFDRGERTGIGKCVVVSGLSR